MDNVSTFFYLVGFCNLVGSQSSQQIAVNICRLEGKAGSAIASFFFFKELFPFL